jgi:hypothetical protein
MLIAAIQTLLTAIACALVVVAWRWFRRDRTIALLVGAGIVIRAIAGQLLFWISYLALPVGRSLQGGSGFWFYAIDGMKYYRGASALANHGIGAVFTVDPAVVSPAYTHLLALFELLCGPVVSTALLLNLAAYIATCAVVVKLAGDHSRIAAVSVAAISFAPSLILWSTQPLKDVFFVFLFAAFIGVTASWIVVWRRNDHAFARAIGVTVAMLLVLGAIAGIRWYFALALLVTSAPLLFLGALRTRTPVRAVAIVVAMYGLVAGGAMVLAQPHMPPALREVLIAPIAPTAPRAFAAVLDGTRYSFDRLAGSTRIEAGPALSPAIDPRLARFVSSGLALLLPRPLARATGLIEVHGGRGFWLFADLDTIFFDVVLCFAVVTLFRAPRAPKWRNPLVWLVLAMTLLTAAAFAYCVGNFGALFRYRAMIFIGVVMVPVAAAWATREGEAILRVRSRSATEREERQDLLSSTAQNV